MHAEVSKNQLELEADTQAEPTSLAQFIEPSEQHFDQKIMDAPLQQWPEHWQGLKQEFEWFRLILNLRIESYFNDQHLDFNDIPPPALPDDSGCYYNALVHQHQLTAQQRLFVILAWVSEFSPGELDIFQTKNKLYDLPYAEFGGIHNQSQPGFQPTIQTALFLLSGADVVASKSSLAALFNQTNTLFTQDILIAPSMSDSDADNLLSSDLTSHALLRISSQTRQQLLYGQRLQPKYGATFPAKKLETQLDWADLVLTQATQNQLTELLLWLKHTATLRNEWDMAKTINSGYKALFYGLPGTGKTLTAALLGKKLGEPVYRIDISQVVSKYIGETEKNLERIFNTAEQQNWILFFDEADALFGKRTQVSSSNDRHANIETGYLLQRIESCKNLVILATNLKDNIDEAFIRRFQSIVHFDNPGPTERLTLWQQGFSRQADLSDIDCAEFAQEYELSGAEIINVIRYASLMALEHHNGKISATDLVTAIRREKYKSGQFV